MNSIKIPSLALLFVLKIALFPGVVFGSIDYDTINSLKLPTGTKIIFPNGRVEVTERPTWLFSPEGMRYNLTNQNIRKTWEPERVKLNELLGIKDDEIKRANRRVLWAEVKSGAIIAVAFVGIIYMTVEAYKSRK